MSIHFLGSVHVRPQAAFGNGSSESERFDFKNWLLGSGHAIPLFWLFVFSASDLIDHPANEDEDYRLREPIQIPCTTTKTAASRLRARAALLNQWFGSRSPLDYHVALFADWLDSLPYEYVTLDWYELMAEESTPMAYFQGLLSRVDAEDPGVIPDLLQISTIDPSVRFITLQDADAGSFTQQEMHNFFFLLGDGDHHRPPWS